MRVAVVLHDLPAHVQAHPLEAFRVDPFPVRERLPAVSDRLDQRFDSVPRVV